MASDVESAWKVPTSNDPAGNNVTSSSEVMQTKYVPVIADIESVCPVVRFTSPRKAGGEQLGDGDTMKKSAV